MPATTETREIFVKAETSVANIKALAKLRLKAGAITSKHHAEGTNWVLVSVWNVFGEQ